MNRHQTKILTIILILFTASYSQDCTWQFMGLSEEHVSAIAINHENDSIVYAGTMSNFSAGTYGAIFKSIDAGASWDTLLYGLTCVELTIHPHDPDIIFAALSIANFTPPGVLKFDSEGNWEFMNNGIYVDWETGVATIEIDPVHPNTMYAGTGGIFGGHLYKTINGGEQWQRIGSSQETDNHIDNCGGKLAITINPINTQELYVACNDNSEIHKSTDGGENWFCALCEEPDHVFMDIELDPNNPNIIYAGLYQYGLFKSIDAGSTWAEINNGLTENRITSITISPIDTNEILVSTYECGIFHSLDAGNSWQEYNTGLENLWINIVKYNLTRTAIYCGTYDGIYKKVPDTLNNHQPEILPNSFLLKQNYPNPFNNHTTIPFTLDKSEAITIDVIDMKGRIVKMLLNQFYITGEHSIKWDGTDLNDTSVPSGIYFYRLRNNKISYSRKMILLK